MRHYDLTINILILFVLILTSCSAPSKEENSADTHSEDTSSYFDPLSIIELKPEQKDAFDALDVLQRNTGGHLYSTFVDCKKSGLTPDTTFTLSQTEFKDALDTFTAQFGGKSSQKECEILVEQSSLASDSYYIEFFSYSGSLVPQISSLRGLPTNGEWIIRNIEMQRDLILDWVAPALSTY